MAQIKHVAIAAEDPEATARFYRDVLDLQMVGRFNTENAEGYYLSDGSVNISIMRFKKDEVAGELGTEYSGIHHIGFQVEDMEKADTKLKNANSSPSTEINDARNAAMGHGHGGKNVEFAYIGPDGVMINVSQGGWAGA